MRDGDPRSALRTWLPVAAASVVALCAAGFLAARNAPRPDEFHTLSHVGHGSLSQLWRSYRSADDATPPLAYVFSWSAARVLGEGLLAVRVPFIVSWTVAAGAIAALVRRAGPWAMLAAGLVPSATSLVYVGAYARAYAPVLACLALAACAWQRAADTRRPAGWLVAVAGLGAVAVGLHYAASIVVGLMAAATLLVGRHRPHWRGRAAAPLVGATVALASVVLVASQALDAQGAMEATVRPVDALAFWPSAARPAWLPLLAMVLVLGGTWLVDGLAGPGGRAERLDGELVSFGWMVAVAVPVVTVAAMMATSGVYFHRYAIGAVLGAAIVVAQLTGAAAGRRAVGPVVVGLLLVACLVSTSTVSGETPSADQARRVVTDLELGEGSTPVVVVNEYDFLLLRRYGDDRLGRRLELLTEPGVVDSPHAVELEALVAAGAPFELVGSDAEVNAALRSVGVAAGTPVAGAEFSRPGSPRTLVHVHVHGAS
ncbi:MAG: glycosyltransferase family 39 protein [Aquihabitans sp.]